MSSKRHYIDFLKPSWNSESATPPNQNSLFRLGVLVLSICENKMFDSVFFVPLPEGGIGINFENEQKEICIEILNDTRVTIVSYKKLEEDDEDSFVSEHVICTEKLTDYKFEKFVKFEIINCLKDFLVQK